MFATSGRRRPTSRDREATPIGQQPSTPIGLQSPTLVGQEAAQPCGAPSDRAQPYSGKEALYRHPVFCLLSLWFFSLSLTPAYIIYYIYYNIIYYIYINQLLPPTKLSPIAGETKETRDKKPFLLFKTGADCLHWRCLPSEKYK